MKEPIPLQIWGGIGLVRRSCTLLRSQARRARTASMTNAARLHSTVARGDDVVAGGYGIPSLIERAQIPNGTATALPRGGIGSSGFGLESRLHGEVS